MKLTRWDSWDSLEVGLGGQSPGSHKSPTLNNPAEKMPLQVGLQHGTHWVGLIGLPPKGVQRSPGPTVPGSENQKRIRRWSQRSDREVTP